MGFPGSNKVQDPATSDRVFRDSPCYVAFRNAKRSLDMVGGALVRYSLLTSRNASGY